MVILPVSLVSIIAVFVILLTLAISYFKKLSMTLAIVIANLFVFVLSIFYTNEIINDLGFRPIYLSPDFFPQIYTLFTSKFVHGGFEHILGNMIVLFFMGLAFEHRVGGKKFFLIYLVTGFSATVFYSLFNLNSIIPLVGASGAIFGILGAFAATYPRDKIIFPIPMFIVILARIPVWVAAVMFAALETFYFAFVVGDNIAHLAHIGGLLSGVIISAFFLRKKAHRVKIEYRSRSETAKMFDISNLEVLVKTPEDKKILDRIKQEEIPEIKNAWIDYFIRKARCPNCNEKMLFNGKEIKCKKCGYKINL